MPSATKIHGLPGARRIAARANRFRRPVRVRARRPRAFGVSTSELDMALEVSSGRDYVESVLTQALAASGADETEALYTGTEAALTRYTHNEIHENVVESDRALNVRAVFGKRVGVATTNRLDREGIDATVARAEAIAKLAPEDAQFPGLPKAEGEPAPLPGAFDDPTAGMGPDERAEAVERIARVMHRHELHAAGYFATRADVLAVANSKGVRRFFRATDASVNIKAIGD